MSGAFFGPATDSIYTHDGNGCAYLLHGESRPGWRVRMEMCRRLICTFDAVVDDFGDLVPVSTPVIAHELGGSAA
jgi:hypothetical protein